MSERAARDQLADRIALILDPDALDPVAQEQALAVAEAVIGMVVPLEFWTSDTGDLICDSLVGRYQIQKGGARWCCMYAMGNKRRPKGDDAPTFHKSEAAAKAAARAHHRAQILAAIGITQASPAGRASQTSGIGRAITQQASPAQIGDE